MNRTKIEWTDYTKGWIEALIDGEGSLSLIKERRPKFKAGYTYKPRLNISNKNYELLEKAQKIIGAGAIITSKKTSFHQLDVSSNGLRYLLPKIELIVKEKQRRQLLIALRILARRKGRGHPTSDFDIESLERIYQNIRQFNGRVWNKPH